VTGTTSAADAAYQPKLEPAEQTHVIASTVDQSMLHGLPSWCVERLEEVCVTPCPLITESDGLINKSVRFWCR